MVGDDYSYVLVFQLRDDVLDVFHSNRVHSRERLVQQDEFWVYGKSPGNLAAASFTSGELVAVTFADFVQVEFVQQAFKPLLALFLGKLFGHFHH